MSVHSVLTRFQFTSDTGLIAVPFRIQAEPGRTSYRDWDTRELTVETTVPGTGITFVEHLGWEPAVVTWSLRFASRTDYFTLLKLAGKTGTLVVLAELQSMRGSSEPELILGKHYEHLDHTRIAQVGAHHEVGGVVYADVTFKRAFDPVTRQAVLP